MLSNQTLPRISSLKPKTYRLQLKTSGFSLIELMIVITIMGLLGSIVMPNSFQMLEQHQARLEEKKLIEFVRMQKYQAYLLETAVQIELAGAGVSSSLGTELSFEHISSDPQEIEISELGSFKQKTLIYTVRTRTIERLLGDL